MAKRIFELARELGVQSKVVLAKCRAEGLDIKNHMSTLSAGLEATISDWFSEGVHKTAVETAQHVDLGFARKAAKAARKRRRKKADKPTEAAAEEIIEPQADQPVPAASAAETAAEEQPAQAAPLAEEPLAEIAEVQADQPRPEEPPADQVQPPEEPESPQEPEPQPEKKQVTPAGPQVVPAPAKLQGPRVVRVEKPDFIDRPPPRRRPPVVLTRPEPAAPVPLKREGKEGDGRAAKKHAKRRSPRRKRGRTADSGEKLKEWRNRDLMEREARLAAASGGGLRRHRATVSRKGDIGAGAKLGQVEIDEPITIKKLSAETGVKSALIIRKLMEAGTLLTINSGITSQQAEAAVLEFGIELVIRRDKTAEEKVLEKLDEREKGNAASRAPVVTFLGHVDHGKTSLLDKIRNTVVAEGEAGGITQHIGATRYDSGDRHVVFLDTPGHEAFTAMRARGANMTDVVVLVVAADDGIMPQTIEAISHARAANVPIVVALNKIDVPNANIQRVMGQLAERDLSPQEWGGQTEVIQTNAISGDGIDSLVETLSLEAELLELTSEPDAPARGFVMEAEMDPGKGVIARLLVRDGTLRIGDSVLAGSSFGRVRRMLNDRGNVITEAPPSTPVEISGLDQVPEAGDRFYAVADMDMARAAAAERREQLRAQSLAAVPERTLESLIGQIEAGQVNKLSLIIKADVQGSIEALLGSLEKLGTDEVQVEIIHAAVGGISTGDVALAEASGAVIIGFNVVAGAATRHEADARGVDIRRYRVIYNIIDDIRRMLEEGLAPEIREEIIGRAQVRQTFKVSRIGTVAGCIVTDGTISRNAKVRITRDDIVIEDERSLDSLRRFKDDVRDVRSGMECGLKLAGYDDIKEGDILEFYQRVEVARKLQ